MASEINHLRCSWLFISKNQEPWSIWYTILIKVILTRVPQESFLGLVLFLIYMNHIPSATQYFTFILYTDDTTLFSTMSYSLPALPNEHDVLINGELLKVNYWLVAKRLSLHVYKTKYVIFQISPKDTNNFSLNLIFNHWEIEKFSISTS